MRGRIFRPRGLAGRWMATIYQPAMFIEIRTDADHRGAAALSKLRGSAFSALIDLADARQIIPMDEHTDYRLI